MDKERCIFHLDLDAFFAAVEELDHPEWKEIPMALSGESKRGIITTANYKAREYGVHSAMPVYLALQQCPQLKLVPMHRDRYRLLSRQVMEILESYSRRFEQSSIDEAYLDLTRRPEESLFLAHTIQDEVEEKTGLSISIGISYNKFFAKLASDWKKPRGIFVISSENWRELLPPLSLEKIYGLGKAALAKLHQFGLHRLEDLYLLSREQLAGLLGKQGDLLYRRIRGEDQDPVEPNRNRKSLGVERTFEEDISSPALLAKKVAVYSKMLSSDLKKENLLTQTVTLKVKSSDFRTFSRSRALSAPTDSPEELERIGRLLLQEIPSNRSFRLLGLSASHLSSAGRRQMSFWDEEP